jgi:hypothetical protein
VVDRSLTYIDEAILARTYVTGERNIWESARQGIILYGMNWKPILKTAVVTALIKLLRNRGHLHHLPRTGAGDLPPSCRRRSGPWRS